MRIPRFRFTIRRMMVAVAIAGVLLAGGLWVGKMIRLSRSHSSRPRPWPTPRRCTAPTSPAGSGLGRQVEAGDKVGECVRGAN